MKSILLPAIITLLSAGAAEALTFDETVLAIANKSLETAAAMAEAEATAAEQATAANLADPEVEGEYLFGKGDGNRWNIGVTQSFDWPGVYAARRRAAEATTRAARLSAAGSLADAKVSTRRALNDYVNATLYINALLEIDKSLNQMLTLISDKEGVDLTRLDINKLKIERARLDSKIALWKAQRDEAIEALKQVAPTTDVYAILSQFQDVLYPVYPEATPAAYVANIGNDNRIKALEAGLEADELLAEVAKRERYPGFSLGYVHAYEDEIHFNGFKVGLTLPVFSTRGKRQAAAARTRATEASLLALRTSIEAEITTTCNRACFLKNAAKGYSDIFDVNDVMALLGKAYQGGQISILEYITEANYLLDSRFEYFDLLYQYNQAMATLSRWE